MTCRTGCQRQQGFTIIELMIAVTIVGALAGLAIPNYLGYLDKARLARCIAEIRYIERAVDSYEAANESLPNTLAEVGAGDMVDPWGNPYAYLNIAALTLPGRGGGSGGGVPSGGTAESGTTSWVRRKRHGPSGAGGGSSNPASHGASSTSFWFEPSSAYAAAPANSNRPSQPRKDRFLHPINSDYDLYSMGKDGESVEPLTAQKSHDDVIRANDGSFVGLAVEF
ncbi:MAG: prepilin-type N-terminal cleavage/methylation domain-containing protein [Nitrospira sp.]|nr:prepilin-type N-terminal cleavage/methylation domain-containing protein [Nitrospira sp.]